MKKTTLISNALKRIKSISLLHLLSAVAAALASAGIAAASSPLSIMKLPAAKQLLCVFIVFAAMFLFFVLLRKPKPSVFRWTKIFYSTAVPFLLIFAAGILFKPSRAELYHDEFFSRFLPEWTALWLAGTAAASILLRLAGHAVSSGSEKDSGSTRLVYAIAAMYTPQKTISKQKREGKAKWIAFTACAVMTALAVFICTVTLFLHTVYSNMDFEAILFTIRFAAGGLALEDILSGTALTVFFCIVTGYICFHLFKCFTNESITLADTGKKGSYTLVLNGRKRALHIVLSAVFLVVSILLFSAETHFFHYLKMKSGTSDIYEQYYVAPDESVVSFPDKKRNLIFIYLESIENTYASKQAGGVLDKNYISELTDLANDKDSVSFSNTQLLGGASVYVPSITFTQGSTVAQTSGISLNTKIFPDYTAAQYPAMTRLEDILHDNGYEQLYIEGSKGEFSMYDKYVGRYEDSTLFDRKTAADKGYCSEDSEYIWKWGIEDRKLIDITKQLITDISQKDKPFFVTMYTMDTHTFESGHRCKDCDSSIHSDYLASVDCTSKQISELVSWIKQQPFYENTTIVLVGDHLGNEKTTMIDIDESYVRTTYNCIINPAKQAISTKNREFSSLDMFPTTLSAIGAQIKGDRLGLGTDLFSSSKTLCEQLGKEEYMKQLEQSSKYYDTVFYK